MTKMKILYKENSTGKVLFWSCKVVDNKILVEWGQVDGKVQQKTTTCFGKNKGRKNETTGEEQAQKEALSMWNKKKKGGYVENLNDPIHQQFKPFKPMKGYPLELTEDGQLVTKQRKNFSFTGEEEYHFIQPKYDGVRCIAALVNDEVVLWSNNCRYFPFLIHIKNSLREHFDSGGENLYFDGEIYSNSLSFPVINGICNPDRKNPHPDENELIYVIFDIITMEQPQFKRLEYLKTFDFDYPLQHAPTYKINRMEEMMNIFQNMVKEGFEGIILRHYDMVYKPNQRSTKLLKHKPFFDEEMKVVGVEGNNICPEDFVWVVIDEDGNQYKVKPTGDRSQRLYYFNNATEYLGKKLTVKYQEKFPDGSIRFGTAKEFRHDI